MKVLEMYGTMRIFCDGDEYINIEQLNPETGNYELIRFPASYWTTVGSSVQAEISSFYGESE